MNFIIRLLKLIFGLFLWSVAIVLSLNANIGYAPWEVFHVGISLNVPISIGIASIIVGFILIIVDIILGEKIGLGTILNMILIGVFLDLLMMIDVLPYPGSFIESLLMFVVGLPLIAVGSYLYIGAGFGAGPRDSLMVGFRRKTGLPVGLCRGLIEGSVCLFGWLLGGMVGLGTIIFVFGIGPTVQLVFYLFKFETSAVKQENVIETFQKLFKFSSDKNNS